MRKEITPDTDVRLLDKCKSLIASKLGWEDSGSWTNHDFQTLSSMIQDATGVNLSVATLKRLWGKVKYDSKPTITTLNTLAMFMGYDNWRGFKQSQSNGHAENGMHEGVHEHFVDDAASTLSNGKSSEKKRWRSGLIGTALCGGIAFLLYYLLPAGETPPSVVSYQFSSKKVVSEGIPNSVIFDYDATAAGPNDTIYIQQSWDTRLRTQVSREDKQHTSIYYTPGFFQAKLVVNGEIVKEHNLSITSKGWMALVKQDPVPVYFNNEDFRKTGMLSLPLEKLEEKDIPFQPQVPWTSYYNVRDFGELYTDNFEFRTKIRNDYKESSGICQFTQILILTDGDVMAIPLSIKGCVSDLGLYFGGISVDGKKTDLSGLGCELSEWVNVRCEVQNGIGSIFIDDTLAHQSPFPAADKIVGLIFRFQGTGSIDEVSLSYKGENVFHDKFD